MIDLRYIILIVFVLLIISITSSIGEDEVDDNKIRVSKNMYDKFVNVLLKFAHKAENDKRLAQYMYIATYKIMSERIESSKLKQLENRLRGLKIGRTDITYPSFPAYPNLQIAIANSVRRDILGSERRFMRNIDIDRKIIDVYLSMLFDSLKIEVF